MALWRWYWQNIADLKAEIELARIEAGYAIPAADPDLGLRRKRAQERLERRLGLWIAAPWWIAFALVVGGIVLAGGGR